MICLLGSLISADQTNNMNNKHCEKDSNPESDQNKEMEDIETREKLDCYNQQGMYACSKPPYSFQIMPNKTENKLTNVYYCLI